MNTPAVWPPLRQNQKTADDPGRKSGKMSRSGLKEQQHYPETPVSKTAGMSGKRKQICRL
jgi:hypothetical protein